MGKNIQGYTFAACAMAIILGAAIAFPVTQAYAWNNNCDDDKYEHQCGNNNCQHHKYGEVCDNSNKDITCNILSPLNHAVIHNGGQKWVQVDFTIQASDPVDGIKKVQVHMTHDNTSTKVASLGGDGNYHVTWTTLGKGSHTIKVSCSDFAKNTKHDSITIQIKK